MQPFRKAYAVSLAATIFFSRIARIELVTATTRTGRTSNTGLPRSRSRSPLRARSVASSVQRSPRARNSCRRAFLLRELRTRSWSFSFGWYRDVMQLGELTPSAMHVEGPEPRHGLTVVYRQECPDIVRHWKKYRRTRMYTHVTQTCTWQCTPPIQKVGPLTGAGS